MQASSLSHFYLVVALAIEKERERTLADHEIEPERKRAKQSNQKCNWKSAGESDPPELFPSTVGAVSHLSQPFLDTPFSLDNSDNNALSPSSQVRSATSQFDDYDDGIVLPSPFHSAEQFLCLSISFEGGDVVSDPESEGSDRLVKYNDEVERKLDVSLVHTLTDQKHVLCVRFNKDGTYLAVGCQFDATVHIYCVKTGEKTRCVFQDFRSSCFN